MKLSPFSVSLLSISLAFPVLAQDSSKSVMGNWITESGNFEVEIAPCGTELCGKVVKVMGNKAMAGPGSDQPKVDAKSVMGLNLLSKIKETEPGKYEAELYDRENEKTYKSVITRNDGDSLSVRAYVGIPLFGKTQIWKLVK